jgi:hypothetical protein
MCVGMGLHVYVCMNVDTCTDVGVCMCVGECCRTCTCWTVHQHTIPTTIDPHSATDPSNEHTPSSGQRRIHGQTNTNRNGVGQKERRSQRKSTRAARKKWTNPRTSHPHETHAQPLNHRAEQKERNCTSHSWRSARVALPDRPPRCGSWFRRSLPE